MPEQVWRRSHGRICHWQGLIKQDLLTQNLEGAYEREREDLWPVHRVSRDKVPKNRKVNFEPNFSKGGSPEHS